MIYSIFMRKNFHDASPFPTTVMVNGFLNKFMNDDDIVIAFPGYMSRTLPTIDHFIKSIKFPPNTYFTVGKNGKDKPRFAPTTTKKIQEIHNGYFSPKMCGLKSTDKDHAKMIFFLSGDGLEEDMTLTRLLSLNVKAVLLGSSNQSNTTYFKPTADKGEADILLINGNFIDNDERTADAKILEFFRNPLEGFRGNEEQNEMNEFNNDDIKNSIALFKEMDSPENFLKNIFTQTIKKLSETD